MEYINKKIFEPEGMIWNIKALSDERCYKALAHGEILDAKVTKCDDKCNLYLSTADSSLEVMVPLTEYELHKVNEDGREEQTRVSSVKNKVGRTIKVKIVDRKVVDGKVIYTASRKSAQNEFYKQIVENATKGDVLHAKVVSITDYAIFCDIGCGVVALLPVADIAITRYIDLKNQLSHITELYVVIKSIDGKDEKASDTNSYGKYKITLSHKELLGTWQEASSQYNEGDTLLGKVRYIENDGKVYVEINQALNGILRTHEDVQINDDIIVRVRAKSEEHTRIRLDFIELSTNAEYKTEFTYNKTAPAHIDLDAWRYNSRAK